MVMDDHCKGISIAVTAVMSGSACAVFVRMLGHSNAFTQSLIRSAPCLTTLLLLAAVLWGGRTPSKLKSLGWVGVGGCVFLVTQDLAITAGFLMTKVSNVVFIINTSPVFCVLMDRFVLKEALPLRTIVMVVLGITGVLVILLDDILFSKEAVGQAEEEQARNTTLGNFICLLNPISWSFYWMIVRRSQKKRDVVAATNAAAQKSLDAGEGGDGAEPNNEEHWWDEMLAIQIVAALLTAFFSVIGMLASGWSEQLSTVKGSDVPIYIAFGVYLPFVLLMFSLAPRYIATAEMGCIKMLETIVGPIWVYLYDGETPNGAAYVGGAIIITAVLGHSIATMRAAGDSAKRNADPGAAAAGTAP